MNPLVAAHLKKAADRHVAWCRENGHQVPEDFIEFVRVVTADQTRSMVDVGEVVGDDRRVQALAVDVRTAADLLGVSPATLWRRVGSGEVGSVKMGRRRLVPKSEIDRVLSEARRKVSHG